ADAHLVVGQALHGEVLPELPVLEVIPAQLFLPVLVGLDLVDEHRPLLAAVSGQITLPVAVDIEPPYHPRPGDRLLPDRRVHRPAVPGHVLRHPHIDRQQSTDPRRHGADSCTGVITPRTLTGRFESVIVLISFTWAVWLTDPDPKEVPGLLAGLLRVSITSCMAWLGISASPDRS